MKSVLLAATLFAVFAQTSAFASEGSIHAAAPASAQLQVLQESMSNEAGGVLTCQLSAQLEIPGARRGLLRREAPSVRWATMSEMMGQDHPMSAYFRHPDAQLSWRQGAFTILMNVTGTVANPQIDLRYFEANERNVYFMLDGNYESGEWARRILDFSMTANEGENGFAIDIPVSFSTVTRSGPAKIRLLRLTCMSRG